MILKLFGKIVTKPVNGILDRIQVTFANSISTKHATEKNKQCSEFYDCVGDNRELTETYV